VKLTTLEFHYWTNRVVKFDFLRLLEEQVELLLLGNKSSIQRRIFLKTKRFKIRTSRSVPCFSR